MRIDALTTMVQPAGAAPAPSAQPAEVDPKLHRAALQFEQLLVRQLTQILADTAKSEDEDGSSATSFYADQLPDALASAITEAGGLGLGLELERAMRTQSS